MVSRPSSPASHPSYHVTSDEGYDSQNRTDSTHEDKASIGTLLDMVRGLSTHIHEMHRRQEEMMKEIRQLSDTVRNLEDMVVSHQIRREESFFIPNDTVLAPVAPAGTPPPPTGLPSILLPITERPPVAGPSTNPAAAVPLPQRRSRRLAREDSFCHRPVPATELLPRRLTQQDAFYHISNSHTHPFKAPNGGVYPAGPSTSIEEPTAPSSSSRKRKTSASSDAKDEEAGDVSGGSSGEERSTKRRRNRKDGNDSSKKTLVRRQPARRASSRK